MENKIERGTNMFKDRFAFGIDDMEALDFCRVLGKHGFRFEVSELRNTVAPDGSKRNYRVIVVYATRRKSRLLYDEFDMFARRKF